jgi:hypothetical protein
MTENLDEKEFSHSLSRAQDGELSGDLEYYFEQDQQGPFDQGKGITIGPFYFALKTP